LGLTFYIQARTSKAAITRAHRSEVEIIDIGYYVTLSHRWS
jgi:hypothetical protein